MQRARQTISVPFTMQVPADIHLAPGTGPRPLLLVLHGQGMRPETFAHHYSALLDLDAHVAFARGIYPLEVGGRPAPRPRRIGYGWYTYDGDQEHFAAELQRGTAHLDRLLDECLTSCDVDTNRVAMLAFSQGAYLGYIAALRLAHRLAAFVGCAGRLKDEIVPGEIARTEHRFPILHIHGRADDGVSFADAERSVATLQEHGWDATLHGFDGGHLLGAAEVRFARDWLARVLGVGDAE